LPPACTVVGEGLGKGLDVSPELGDGEVRGVALGLGAGEVDVVAEGTALGVAALAAGRMAALLAPRRGAWEAWVGAEAATQIPATNAPKARVEKRDGFGT
jgi:hypothetical protein